MSIFYLGFPIQGYCQSDILTKVKQHPAFESARLGVLVKNLSTNQVLLSHNEDAAMTPASTLKMVTAIRVLEDLGPDYRFRTEVIIAGAINGNTLVGDIIIKGFGDPVLDHDIDGAVSLSDISKTVYNWLKQNNIDQILGEVIADASWYDLPGIPRGYDFEDIGNYYGAGCYGLNVKANRYEVVFNRNSDYGVTLASFDSLAIEGITAEVKARGRYDQAYIFPHPGGGVHITGDIPAGTGEFKINGAIPNPPLYVAKSIQKNLSELGIGVSADPVVLWNTGVDRPNTIKKFTFQSPKLIDLLKEVLHESDNMISQTLHREWMKLSEPDLEDCNYCEDGSGLSRENSISANDMIKFQESIVASKHFDLLLESLPLNAREGNVKSVLRSYPGRLYIKSGSIGRVQAYCGFKLQTNGDIIGFACFANDLTVSGSKARKGFELLLKWIAELQ